MRSTGLTDPLAWTPEAQGRGRKTRSNGQMDNTQAASRSKTAARNWGRNRDQNQDEIPAPETFRGRSLTASGKK